MKKEGNYQVFDTRVCKVYFRNCTVKKKKLYKMKLLNKIH